MDPEGLRFGLIRHCWLCRRGWLEPAQEERAGTSAVQPPTRSPTQRSILRDLSLNQVNSTDPICWRSSIHPLEGFLIRSTHDDWPHLQQSWVDL